MWRIYSNPDPHGVHLLDEKYTQWWCIIRAIFTAVHSNNRKGICELKQSFLLFVTFNYTYVCRYDAVISRKKHILPIVLGIPIPIPVKLWRNNLRSSLDIDHPRSISISQKELNHFKLAHLRLQMGTFPDHFPSDKQVRVKFPSSTRWFSLHS
jgi:hypothetical protein